MGHADCRAGLAIIFQRYDMRQYDNVSKLLWRANVRKIDTIFSGSEIGDVFLALEQCQIVAIVVAC